MMKLWKCCTQYANIWKTQQWPQDWKSSVFIPITKKNNAKESSNFHTVALITHASKVIHTLKNMSLNSVLCLFPSWCFFSLPWNTELKIKTPGNPSQCSKDKRVWLLRAQMLELIRLLYLIRWKSSTLIPCVVLNQHLREKQGGVHLPSTIL